MPAAHRPWGAPVSSGNRHHFLLRLHFVRGIVIVNSLARFADHYLLAVAHFVIGLRTQHHLAAHAFVGRGLPPARCRGNFATRFMMAKNIFGNPMAQAVALGVPLGELLLIFGGNFSRFFLFFFDLGRLRLELRLRRFDVLFRASRR